VTDTAQHSVPAPSLEQRARAFITGARGVARAMLAVSRAAAALGDALEEFAHAADATRIALTVVDVEIVDDFRAPPL
jgi:hypothetical protein